MISLEDSPLRLLYKTDFPFRSTARFLSPRAVVKRRVLIWQSRHTSRPWPEKRSTFVRCCPLWASLLQCSRYRDCAGWMVGSCVLVNNSGVLFRFGLQRSRVQLCLCIMVLAGASLPSSCGWGSIQDQTLHLDTVQNPIIGRAHVPNFDINCTHKIAALCVT